jgi:hypothetical protein
LPSQSFERFGIGGKPLGLEDRGPIMVDAQPIKVLIDAFHKFRPAATSVEVFDPEEKTAAAPLCGGMADCRRVGVAEMQPP